MFTLVFGGTASKSISGTNAVRRTTERSMSCTIRHSRDGRTRRGPRGARRSRRRTGARRRQSLTSSDLLEACARTAWICASFAAERASFCSTSFGAREAAVEELAEPGRLARGRLLSCLERPGLVGDRRARRGGVSAVERRQDGAPLRGRAGPDEHGIDESGGELRSDAGLLPRLQRAHVATRPAIADRLCPATTVTPFGSSASATLFTALSARRISQAPESSVTVTRLTMTAGTSHRFVGTPAFDRAAPPGRCAPSGTGSPCRHRTSARGACEDHARCAPSGSGRLRAGCPPPCGAPAHRPPRCSSRARP